MTTKTHIPGKDASLEDTIEKAQALLDRHGFSTELVSWLNPVPHCWSVHLRSTQCPQLYTNGKGASQLASQVSAVLEFFERISTNLFFADYYLESAADGDFVFYPSEKWFPVSDLSQIPMLSPDGSPLLSEKLFNFYNPGGELTPALLRDNNSDHAGRGIAALPFEHVDTGEIVYFPVSILNNLYASNGMAAGNTPAECRAQALAEIVERYIKNKIIAEGICLPGVPQDVIKRYPHIQQAITELENHGFPIMVKDASLGGRFPVVCVLLVNPENSGCYASFGASCRFEVALERTVTELLQGRQLDQLSVFQPPSHDLATVADSLNLESHFIDSGGVLSWRMFRDTPDFAFQEWDFSGSTDQEYGRLKETVRSLGFHAYCAEYVHCGMYTCRIIAPGMSEVYPVDDLVWNNKTIGASLRPGILRLNQMTPDELSCFLGDLNELGLNDEQPVSDLIGVLFEEDSAWHSLRIGELKAMVALATGDLDVADEWCLWCLSFNHLPLPRQKLYRAVHHLIGLELSGENPAEYLQALDQFFGSAVMATARQIVSGEVTFYGLAFADTWTELSPAHAHLLEIYKMLHPLKAAGSR